MLDFMRCIKKSFRKALKHGSDLRTLFNLVENYIRLRFLAYEKLFGESTSQNEKKRIVMDHDEFFLSLSGLDLTYDELTKLLINDNSDEDAESYTKENHDHEDNLDIEVEEYK